MEELELRDYLRVLRKRRWLLVAVLAATLAGGALATALAVPVYEARAKLFVGERQVTTTEIQEGVQVSQLSLQLLKTYAEVIRTRSIAERAVEADAIPISPTDLTRELRADPILDTQLIRLTYASTDPTLAQRVVNAVARSFVDEVQRIEHRQQEGEPAVRVSIIEPALRPTGPVSPKPVRNMALALVLGLMLGVGVAFVAEYLDTSVKDREDVEGVLGLPAIAAVPQVQTDAEVYLERDTQSIGAEAFRKVRTAVQFLGVDHPIQTLLVTSPFAREGKTTVATNLALAYAQAGLRTLLLESDLRRPSFHHVFRTDEQRGLTTVLIGRIPLEQAIQQGPVRNLWVMPAGALPPNPAELLGSEHMADVLARLRSTYDVVLLDAPPILPVADAAVLSARVDGVLMVARAGKTNRDRLREAAQAVDRAGGRFLGVVLNFLKVEGTDYAYSYYYGYRSQAPKQEAFQTRTPENQPSRNP